MALFMALLCMALLWVVTGIEAVAGAIIGVALFTAFWAAMR